MKRATWLGGIVGAAAGWSLVGRSRARVPRSPEPPRPPRPWTEEQDDARLAGREQVMPDAEHAAVPRPDDATKTTSQPDLGGSVARQVALDESQGLPAPERLYKGAR